MDTKNSSIILRSSKEPTFFSDILIKKEFKVLEKKKPKIVIKKINIRR
jgi:hypothetical protein